MLRRNTATTLSIQYTSDKPWNTEQETKLNEVRAAYRVLKHYKLSSNMIQSEIINMRDQRRAVLLNITVSRKLRNGETITATERLNISNLHKKDAMKGKLTAVKQAKDALRYNVRSYRSNLRVLDREYRDYSGVRYRMCGLVHTEPGTILTIAKGYKKAKVSIDKTPKSDVRHVGVEIEFISSLDADDITEKLVAAGLQDHVTLKEDGSVKDTSGDNCDGGCRDNCSCDLDENGEGCGCECDCSSGKYGHEICILGTEKKINNIVTRVCSVLDDVDAEINHTCGLHVHLDMRSRSAARAYSNLVNSQDLLFNMVPQSRRSNQFCQPNSSNTLFNTDRYRAINATALKKHQTIEVRLHSGSTNAVKIINWITLLIRIVNARGVNAKVASLATAPKAFRLNTKLKGYIRERMRRFTNADAA